LPNKQKNPTPGPSAGWCESDLQNLQFPVILTDDSGQVQAANLDRFELEVTTELQGLLTRHRPGESFSWGEKELRVITWPGDSTQRLYLVVSPDRQEELRQQQAEIADYADKVDKMHFLQEMLETRGAELNIAHQRLLENSRQLQLTRNELEERQRQMQDNFNVARTIVEELFPFPALRSENITIFGRTHVANSLSGDFFDIISQRPGEITAVLADVSGHGLPSAMILMMARLLLNTFSSSTIMPRDLLMLTHNELYENIPRGNYIAIGVLNISQKNGMISYAIGGLYAAVVLRHRAPGLLRLPTNNYALAFKPDCEFHDNQFQLLPGDKLVLFTDGLPETVDEEGNLFDLDRLHEILAASKHLSGHGLRQRLFEEQVRFAGDMPIQDDTSVLVVEMDQPPLFEATITTGSDGLDAALSEITSAIDWQLTDENQVEQLKEVLMHAVRNGIESCERNNDRIEVKVQVLRDLRQVKIRVTDSGPGFKRPVAAGVDADSLEMSPAGGRGFACFYQVMDEIYLNETGNEINLIKYLEEDDYGD